MNGFTWTRMIAKPVLGWLSTLGFSFGVQLVSAPVVDVTGSNAGATVERDECLTISLGENAAYECGDLRVVHDLPGVQTYSRLNTPTLIYSSQDADPYPIVSANVTLPDGKTNLSRVTALLTVNGQRRASSTWKASTWPTGTARVAIGYSALSDPTSIYRYALDVTAYYTTGSATTHVTGDLTVVNRRNSYFGAGWWLAGLEQLLLDSSGQPSVWIAGDGSVRRYHVADANTWTAPAVDRPDTLKREGSGYVRLEATGVRVVFDSLGRHIKTRNRLGHETLFAYDNVGRLSTITLPPASANKTFTFNYALGGYLSSVNSPGVTGNRVTKLTMDGVRLLSIRDPNLSKVSFGYLNSSSARIVSRVDEAGAQTAYRFDIGRRLSASRINLGTTDSIVTNVRSAESVGLADTAGLGAVDTAQAYTRLDGPRLDVGDTTLFWLDKFGGPKRVQDALGRVTIASRGDSRFPALVTQLVAPNGLVTQASYDARGNVSTITVNNPYADGRNAVSQYVWDATWDQLLQATSATGIVLTFGIDPSNGNRTYQQFGSDQTTRATFSYGANSLIAGTVIPGGTRRDTVIYDSSLQNVSETRSPLGIRTQIQRDAIGRVTRTTTPLDNVDSKHVFQDVYYDAMDRDTLSVTWSDSAYTPDSAIVRKHFNVIGQHDTIWTRSAPGDDGGITWDRHVFGYDAAHRLVSESLSNLLPTTFVLDPAGNRLNGGNSGGAGLEIVYDALNRVVEKRGLQTFFGADTAHYTYDPASGDLIVADNKYASIHRSYYPNGALKTDTLRIALRAGTDTPTLVGTTHVYGLSYTYDLDGKRSSMSLSGTPQSYSYSPLTGDLASITGLDGHRYDFQYDIAQRLHQVTRPAESTDNLVELMGYDDDSRLTSLRVNRVGSLPAVLRNDSVIYDARGKILAAGPESYKYSPLGGVISGVSGRVDQVSESFSVDALGRMLHRTLISADGTFSSDYRYGSATAHLDTIVTANQVQPDTTSNGYDGWGTLTTVFAKHNVSGSQQVQSTTGERILAAATRESRSLAGPHAVAFDDRMPTITMYELTKYFHLYDSFGMLGSTRMTKDTLNDPNGIPHYQYETREKHRYDALGRRVWTGMLRGVNTLGDCARHDQRSGCKNTVTWTAWDGDQMVREMRGQFAQYDTLFAAENGSQTVTYVHGGAIDQPLSVNGVYTFTNARGILDIADCMGGACNVQPAGETATAYGDPAPRGAAYDPPWNGTLLESGRTGSGLLYRRNRYLDGNTGAFTQTDPIGLGGGLSSYGFAAGDPINYSDPFGLCPKTAYQSICIDLWITQATAGPLRGDARGPDPDAPPWASRAQIVINVEDLKASYLTVSPSCMTGGNCYRNSVAQALDKVEIDKGANGALKAKYSLHNRVGVYPAINGSVQLLPDGRGGYASSGNRDAFPSMAIYGWNGSRTSIRSPNTQSDWTNLFPGRRKDKW